MDKQEIRKIVLHKRSLLTPEEASSRSEALCRLLMERDEYKEADIILGYISKDNEVILDTLFKDAMVKGKRIYVPRTQSGNTMDFYLYDGNFKVGKYGIKEPTSDEKFVLVSKAYGEEICHNVLMIMPGVAYDSALNRIGHGGGYYDRFLEKYRTIKKAALAYDFQMFSEIPYEEHDIKPDIMINENY